MKKRTTILALVLCVMSSLAFADNPSDAPLVNEVQQDTTASTAVVVHQRKNKNKDACSAQEVRQTEKSQDRKATPNVPAPAQAVGSAAL